MDRGLQEKKNSFHKLNAKIHNWREEKNFNAASEGRTRATPSAQWQLAVG